ncbi:MAG: hypothetical protein QGG88_09715 [Gammaproteobacteria bacterium]|nr:hypothetical protein [Gammaproteobacteria bacterium]
MQPLQLLTAVDTLDAVDNGQNNAHTVPLPITTPLPTITTNTIADDGTKPVISPARRREPHAVVSVEPTNTVPTLANQQLANQQRVGFIPFAVGIYRDLPAANAEHMISLLRTLPVAAPIILTGHSYSRQQQASDQLAQLRATTAKEILVKNGISPLRIVLQTDAVNQFQEGDLLHGVSVHTQLPIISDRTVEPSPPVAELEAKAKQELNAEDDHSLTEPSNISEGLSTTATTISVAPKVVNQDVGFVAFEVGRYRHVPKQNTDIIITQLQALPKQTPIILTGHSHSRQQWASNQLALLRASTLRDQLTTQGIAPERVKLQADAINNAQQATLLHGVTVQALLNQPKPLPEPVVEEALVVAEEQEPLAIVQPDLRTADSHNQADTAPSEPYVASTLAAPQGAAKVTNDSLSLCQEISFEPGSLRANIERQINDCNYVMGRWVFGSGNDLLDWDVPLGFHTTSAQGLVGLLSFIEQNYQIRAHVHELDHSIDFLPSVNQMPQVLSHADD